jgi:hypothetical protein
VDGVSRKLGVDGKSVFNMEWGEVARTLGSLDSLSSTSSFRRRFISLMQVAMRPPSLISSSFPFSHSLSCLNEESAREVVVDRR